MAVLWVVVAVGCLLLTLAVCVVAGVWVFRSRREFLQLPDAFRCQLRLVRGSLRGARRQWPRRAGWASWAHDVLLLRSGWWPAGTQVLRVRFPETSVEPACAADLAGLGTDPVVLRLRLDEGTVVDVAAPAADRERLAGPYLVACVSKPSRPSKGPPPGR